MAAGWGGCASSAHARWRRWTRTFPVDQIKRVRVLRRADGSYAQLALQLALQLARQLALQLALQVRNLVRNRKLRKLSKAVESDLRRGLVASALVGGVLWPVAWCAGGGRAASLHDAGL